MNLTNVFSGTIKKAGAFLRTLPQALGLMSNYGDRLHIIRNLGGCCMGLTESIGNDSCKA